MLIGLSYTSIEIILLLNSPDTSTLKALIYVARSLLYHSWPFDISNLSNIFGKNSEELDIKHPLEILLKDYSETQVDSLLILCVWAIRLSDMFWHELFFHQ